MSEIKQSYDHSEVENKWQKKWEKSKVFEVDSQSEEKKEKYYCLEMFPYPSGAGLHIGHTLNYTIGDIIARYKRMAGYSVLYPMGYDAFGLPAENAAIKAGEHPKSYTEKAIKSFIGQQKALGLSYDWSKMLASCYPEYYKWNQYFFLKFLEKGLVYRAKAPVNWCPKCQTVLANEQAQGGKCWRHEDTDVEIKHLEQWFIKTTAYTEELLNEIENLEWPERIKSMQRNWIGKSEGSEIIFEVETPAHEGCTREPEKTKWPIFTTRPDTLFGVTFMVVSAQHPKLMELVTADKEKEVEKFVKKINSVSQEEIEKLDKEGVFTGSYAINPVNGEKVPIYAGNFVLAEYGSGMVMAVPAHDQRDFDFAKKYSIEIKEVVRPMPEEKKVLGVGALIETTEKGKFIFQKRDNNAEFFPGKTSVFGGHIEKGESSSEAIKRELKEELGLEINDKQIEFLCCVDSKKEKGKQNNYFYVKGVDKNKLDLTEGEEIVESGLDDILKNPEAGPFVSPVIKAFRDKDQKAYAGHGILFNSGDFDGLDNQEAKDKITEFLAEKDLAKKTVQYKFRDWLVSRQRYWGTPIPVVYCDKCGIVPVPENELPVVLPDEVDFGEGNPLATNENFVNIKCPKCGNPEAKRETDTMDTFVDSSWYFMRFFDNHNKEKAFDKNKADYWMPVDQYIGGAEHACLHLIYARFWTKALRDLGFVDIDEPFKRLFNQGMLHASDGKKMSKSLGNVINPLDIIKTHGADSLRLTLMSFASPDSDTNWDEKVLEGANKFLDKIYEKMTNIKLGKSSPRTESKLNKTIKQVTEDIDNFRNNLAIIKIRGLFNSLKEEESKEVVESCLKLLHPVCPHITEELWEKLGNKEFISIQNWPKADESKIDEEYEKQEQQVEKLVDDINNVQNLIKEKENKETKKAIIYVIPNEKTVYVESLDEIKKRTNLEIEIYSVNDPEIKSGEKDPQEKAKKVKPGKPGIYLE